MTDASPAAAPRGPSKLRLAVFILVGVYPLVTALIYLVSAMTPGWQLWHRTLVLSPVMVAAMVWIIIPRIHRHCHRWL